MAYMGRKNYFGCQDSNIAWEHTLMPSNLPNGGNIA